MPVEGADTLTDNKVKDTYTKLLQINDDNELLNGIGGAVSPVIGGDLNVSGQIFKNGVEVGTSTDSFGLITLTMKSIVPLMLVLV